jgi:hypothetical protein
VRTISAVSEMLQKRLVCDWAVDTGLLHLPFVLYSKFDEWIQPSAQS